MITLAGIIDGDRVTFDEMRTYIVSIFLIGHALDANINIKSNLSL